MGTPVLLSAEYHSPAEFSAALWSVLGYEPESSPGEEVRER